jgi:hypothetical protein
MYSIIKTQTRSSINIPFYFEKHSMSADYQNYFYHKFIVTKKFLSSDTVYSDDKLTVTKTTNWSSRNDFLEFMGDTYCYNNMVEPGREYDIENEITADIEIKGNKL